MSLDLARHISIFVFLSSIGFLAPFRSLAQEGRADPAASLFKQGTDELAAHHYDDAIKDFKKVNQMRHDSCGDCYLEIAVAQTKLGQLDDALRSCDQAISRAKNFYGEESVTAFDGYRDTDVDDLKLIAYDYIRVVRWAQPIAKTNVDPQGHVTAEVGGAPDVSMAKLKTGTTTSTNGQDSQLTVAGFEDNVVVPVPTPVSPVPVPTPVTVGTSISVETQSLVEAFIDLFLPPRASQQSGQGQQTSQGQQQ